MGDLTAASLLKLIEMHENDEEKRIDNLNVALKWLTVELVMISTLFIPCFS